MKQLRMLHIATSWLIAFSIIPAIMTWSCQSRSKHETVILSDSIRSAGELFGLVFTNAELDSMQDGLRDQLKYYGQMRRVSLDNSVPPALIFDPLPEGFVIPTEQKLIDWKFNASVTMPADQAALAFYSVADLSVLIRTHQITSVELTRFFLGRLKKYGDTLHCVIMLTEDLALQQAAKADEEIAAGMYRSPLHGIPYGLKDLVAVKGYKTTWGSVPYQDQLIDQTATVARKLEEAGAVLVAKLSLGELAMDDEWFGGVTRNPWDLTQGSSGSSAGSAAAVAAGLVPFAIGSETWGSIVSPCTRCGATGLRPTFVRVSRTGCMALSRSMDKIGPIARSAGDQLLMTNRTGNPCVVVPNGFDKTNHPSSINFIGQLFDEARVLEVAQRYQNATDFNKRHPEMFKK